MARYGMDYGRNRYDMEYGRGAGRPMGGARDSYRDRGMTWEGHGMDRMGAERHRYTAVPRGGWTRGYGGRDYGDMNRGGGMRGRSGMGRGGGMRSGWRQADTYEGGGLGNWSPGGYGASRGLDSMATGRPRFFTDYGAQTGGVGYRPDWW